MLDERNGKKQTRIRRQSPLGTKFEKVPAHARKMFWMKFSPHHKLYEPVARALRSRGWSLTRDRSRAHIVWRDQPTTPRGIYTALKPWQRYNQLYNTEQWDDKDALAQRMEEYYVEKKQPALHSFPESYVLHTKHGLDKFEQRLANGGLDIPWVLKKPTVNMGQGVQILGPQSRELKGLVQKVRQSEETERLIVQQYICNEMTYKQRKFDFRVFWMVASIQEPVLVLYHTQHNYVRIGHAIYDESNFKATKSHLTTHTFGAEEQKLTWPQFREFVQEQYDTNLKPQLLREDADVSIPPLLHPKNAQPFLHVENQIKTILAHIVDAYRDITFTTKHGESTAQNAFALHAADMILDNNFDVFLVEGTDGPGKDEDYDFRINMHNALFGEMVDIVEHIIEEQEHGRVVDVKAMQDSGILGGYDVIYHDTQLPIQQPKWMFDYRTKRLPSKPCGSHSSNTGTEESDASAVTPSKTFYMPGRVYSDGEPVSRSFRRMGYTPVDDVSAAQIIYNRISDKRLKSSQLWPWQFVTPFPMEGEFFDEHYLIERELLDRSRANGVVCNPLFYNGRQDRRFQVVVYWLVLSTDPLLALYHDGYVYLPYSADDEKEFVSSNDRRQRNWRGSWTSLEQQLRQSSNRRGGVAPIDHVRNQIKQSLVEVVKGFNNVVRQNSHKARYFALFAAEFEVDQHHNVFLTELHDDLMAGEDTQYIVGLHNELYGAALGLIELLNATTAVSNWKTATNDIQLGYEWLVRPHFEYSYKQGHDATECKTRDDRIDILEAPTNWEKVMKH